MVSNVELDVRCDELETLVVLVLNVNDAFEVLNS